MLYIPHGPNTKSSQDRGFTHYLSEGSSGHGHLQASAVDASEERDDVLSQLEAKDELIQQLQEQAHHATALSQQLEQQEAQQSELQLTADQLRLELESHLASRDVQVHSDVCFGKLLSTVNTSATCTKRSHLLLFPCIEITYTHTICTRAIICLGSSCWEQHCISGLDLVHVTCKGVSCCFAESEPVE